MAETLEDDRGGVAELVEVSINADRHTAGLIVSRLAEEAARKIRAATGFEHVSEKRRRELHDDAARLMLVTYWLLLTKHPQNIETMLPAF